MVKDGDGNPTNGDAQEQVLLSSAATAKEAFATIEYIATDKSENVTASDFESDTFDSISDVVGDNAGNYYVWYRAVPDDANAENYTPSDPQLTEDTYKEIKKQNPIESLPPTWGSAGSLDGKLRWKPGNNGQGYPQLAFGNFTFTPDALYEHANRDGSYSY